MICKIRKYALIWAAFSTFNKVMKNKLPSTFAIKCTKF